MQLFNSASRIGLMLALGLASLSGVATSTAAHAQARMTETEETVVVTGARGRPRSHVDSPVPIDVLSGRALRSSGAVSNELGQSIAVLTPSFNFPRQSNSGSSDHVRSGQLRGLSPDQMLVLVNGRRRHTSAIVNSETKIGRGTAAVDFNTIPLSAVRRVEVLRDGAGAQYGSDAIAGVINVLLDDRPSGFEASTTFGAHVTRLDPIGRTITDGETFTLDASMGMALGQGFLRLGGDFKSRQETNRAGFDQIPFFVAPTTANLALRGGRNYAEGDPETEDWNLWFNTATPVAIGEVYGFGTYGERETLGATFFRYPDSAENIISVYPNGYRPQSVGLNEDVSVTGGARTQLSNWDFDASVTFGRNEFEYGAQNSLNASLGPTSPTRFTSGTFMIEQTSANLDVTRSVETKFLSGPLTLAGGIELRSEAFESRRGDALSVEAGPFDLAIGAQGAPGLTADDETSLDRDVASVYAELGGNVTEHLFVEAAARYEDYSDFGGQSTAKLAWLYRFNDVLRLRGAISNSVRAPALQQVGFSDTTLNFGPGRTLVRTRTLPVSNTIAHSLGAEDLRPETSVNYSIGATGRIGRVSFTLDAFRVEIDDRITLSDRLFGSSLETFVQSQPGGSGIQSVRFFTNAIDTETEGVDVVFGYEPALFHGQLELSAAYTYATTTIADFAPTPAALSALDPSFALIGVEEINTIEEAAPDSKLIVSATWSDTNWRLLGRISRYDSTVRVFNFGGGFEPRQEYGAEYQVDTEAEYRLNPRASIAIGASNLLDEYPDLSSSDINFFGNLPYDILSPIGVNGRYLYGRVSFQY